MNYLDETLSIIYIEESFKSLSKEKVQHFLKLLQRPDVKTLEKARNVFPKKDIKDIEIFAYRKNDDFKKVYQTEKRNVKNLHKDNIELYALSMTSIKQLRHYAVSKNDSRASKLLDELILKLKFFFDHYGSTALTLGIILKLISIYATTLIGIFATSTIMSQLLSIALGMVFTAPYLIAIGILMLIIGYLLGLWYKSRQEEKTYNSGSKNPYEDEE